MLFALAIGRVAEKALLLIREPRSVDRNAAAAAAHLFLATVVIVTSWVQWTRAIVEERYEPLEAVFDVAFIGLLVDIGLVICYFMLAETAETSGPPSARPEAFWMFVIFFGYLLWDVATKLLPEGFAGFWERGIVSIICVGLALLAWWSLRNVEGRAGPVILADLALILLVVLFRWMKERFTLAQMRIPSEWPIPIVLLVLFLLVTVCAIKRNTSARQAG
jgi:hypothetical protein